MKMITVSANDSGQRLDKFLTKAFPLLPQGLMYKYIRTKSIKINKARTEASYKLAEGDILTLYINDELLAIPDEENAFLSVRGNINVVFEDDNIILVNKPAGLVVHSDETNSPDTLIARIQRYLYDKNEYNPENELSFAPALCNRIDRNTSGIVIAAKTAEALRIMNEMIRVRSITKKYICAVHGILGDKQGELTNYLRKDSSENRVYIDKEKTPSNVTAITRYTVLKEKGDISLVEAEILTGRTHQIRAQFAAIGHPLLGDTKYGLAKNNLKYGLKHQALVSYYLRFDFDESAEALQYLSGKEFRINDIPFQSLFD